MAASGTWPWPLTGSLVIWGSGKDRKAVGMKTSSGWWGPTGGYLSTLLYHSSFFSLSFIGKEPELELKGQNIKTNPFDLTTYELFTGSMSQAEMSTDTVFKATIRKRDYSLYSKYRAHSSQQMGAIAHVTCPLNSINFTQSWFYFPEPSHPPSAVCTAGTNTQVP